jgi:hypothetical protein
LHQGRNDIRVPVLMPRHAVGPRTTSSRRGTPPFSTVSIGSQSLQRPSLATLHRYIAPAAVYATGHQ